jgi:hypothetical protein
MDKTNQTTTTMANKKEYEKGGQAGANKYDIPTLDSITAQKVLEEYMSQARDFLSDLDQAKYYEKEAQTLARSYNLPVPELSDIEIHDKAKQKVDNYMWKAKHASTIIKAKEWEKMAQALAKEYDLPTPELSTAEIYIKIQEEVNAIKYPTEWDKF